MVRRQAARAHAIRAAEETIVDATPRAARGLILAVALSLPLWGSIGLMVHSLWNLIR